MLNNERMSGVLKYMDQFGIEQMLICDPTNQKYLLGGFGWSLERAFLLYISRKNGIKLIINSAMDLWGDLGVQTFYHGDWDDVPTEIAKHIMKDVPLGVDRLFPAKWLLPLVHTKAASGFLPADRAMDMQRAHKDPAELQQMRESSEINDRVMKKVRGIFYTGMTEAEAAAKISALFMEEGADKPGWVLVAFGENSANVHNMAGQKTLQPGDVILIDMGSARKGYQSDMTRTFFWQSVTEKQRKIYEIVKNANCKAEQGIHPGLRCCDVDDIARGYIAQEGFGEYFTHRLGHYIGLELHDPGDILFTNKDDVEPSMCFSVEPGIYLPGEFGVRVEDLVVVTENGCEILNHDNKELEILGV